MGTLIWSEDQEKRNAFIQKLDKRWYKKYPLSSLLEWFRNISKL